MLYEKADQMCKLFTSANPDLWQSQTRSMRLDGVVTSLRLEKFFWDILHEIARRDRLSVPQLLSRLYHESLEVGHNIQNYTSFLRVCCARYLRLQSNGQIPTDPEFALSQLDTDFILTEEKRNQSYF